MQKQMSKEFFKKGVMRNFAEFTRKYLPGSPFFDKLRLCRSAASLKTRLQRRRFLVTFAKFVRTPFLQNTTRRLLLIIAVSIILVMQGNETVNYDTKTMYQFELGVWVLQPSYPALIKVSSSSVSSQLNPSDYDNVHITFNGLRVI